MPLRFFKNMLIKICFNILKSYETNFEIEKHCHCAMKSSSNNKTFLRFIIEKVAVLASDG